ncbi:hypothetical protein ABVK25_012456 [Lepraria finkii]|uniref:Peptidyl-prolyl cis-trans isomerase n=1 Tax=Lepraria finkii TaxID=1340010 RepID=A0ABR4AFA7_9LECA
MSVTLHTSHGDIKIEVFCESVPKTAENFMALCASGAYNGTPFHRLIPDFMVQGGDTSLSPLNSSELPIVKGGTSIWGEYFEDEIKVPALRHSGRGMVSMANKGPTTNGSQFFMTLKDAPHLDGKNTVFGRVIHGAQEGGTLEKMEAVEVDKKYRPKSEKVVLETVTRPYGIPWQHEVLTIPKLLECTKPISTQRDAKTGHNTGSLSLMSFASSLLTETGGLTGLGTGRKERISAAPELIGTRNCKKHSPVC